MYNYILYNTLSYYVGIASLSLYMHIEKKTIS